LFGHGLRTDKPNWMKSDQDRLTYFVILQLISDAQTAREIEPLVLLLHYCWVDVIWNMFFAKKKKLSKDYIWLHACKAGLCTPELEVNPHASLCKAAGCYK
jgi:hypothetical protein